MTCREPNCTRKATRDGLCVVHANVWRTLWLWRTSSRAVEDEVAGWQAVEPPPTTEDTQPAPGGHGRVV